MRTGVFWEEASSFPNLVQTPKKQDVTCPTEKRYRVMWLTHSRIMGQAVFQRMQSLCNYFGAKLSGWLEQTSRPSCYIYAFYNPKDGETHGGKVLLQLS